MSLFFRIAYSVGFTPWEHAATHRPAAEHIAALFDREESERKSPYGRALDLGCGTGYWSVELASRGWQVTGIDIVPKAVRKARERAQKA
ncbi:MAG: class I SAM-dependent methyltransferase, partial [Geminicoccales bacterium]